MRKQTRIKLIVFTCMLLVFVLVNKFLLNEQFGPGLILTGVVILLPITLLVKLKDTKAGSEKTQ